MPTEQQRNWVRALAGNSLSAPATKTPANEVATGASAAAASDQPAPVASAVRLGGSVGIGGRNAPDDVRAVQSALNRRTKAGLEEDGKCGKNTITAILAFQKQLAFQHPDGRVDPGGPTERALNGDAVSAPSAPSAPSAIGGGSGGKVGSDGKGGSSSKQAAPARPPGKEDAKGKGGGEQEPDYERLARQIHAATEGIGTDEEAIFAALRELKGSRERRALLGDTYRRLFGEDMEEVLRSELDDREQKRAEDEANARGDVPDFERLARQIHDAAEGLGTDEAAIHSALEQVKGNPAHMTKLRLVYRTMFGRTLDDVLREELSGKDLKRAQDGPRPSRDVVPEVIDKVEEIRGLEGVEE